MPRMRGHWGEDGAAATEFAIIVPILILLFFGIVFFGLTIYRQQVVESATREAARVMSIGGSVDDIEAALDRASVGFAADELNVDRSAFERDGSPVGTLGGSAEPCDGSADTATVVARSAGDRFDFTVPFFSGGRYEADFAATATFECEV